MCNRQDLYFLFFVASIFLLINPGRLNLDDYHRLVSAVTMVEYGKLDLHPQYLPETGYVYYRSSDGRLFVHWGLISGMLYIPAAILGKFCRSMLPFIGQIESQSGKALLVERFLGSMLIMPSIMLANVILLQQILQRYFGIASRRILYLLLVLAFFCTQLLTYSSDSEEGFMILLFLAALIVNRECEQSWKKGLWIGTLTGLAMNSRYYIGIPVFCCFILWEVLQRKGVLQFLSYFTIALVPYALIFVLYNYARYGSFSPDGFFLTYVKYGFSPPDIVQFSYRRIANFLWERLVGQKGIFIYNPILILAPWGISILLKEGKLNIFKKHLLVLSGIIVLCYLAVHAILTWGVLDGASWGPRYLTATVPFLFLLSVPAILRVAGYCASRNANRFTLKGLSLAVIVIISGFIQILSVLGWDETEMYQGHSRNHIIQRAQNIWNISFHGNPLAPHQTRERALLADKKVEEVTNKNGELEAIKVDISSLYEGFALWPVTLGYALGWSTWKTGSVILINLASVCFFGFLCFRGTMINQSTSQTAQCL